ncbi:MAG: VWA domain-containing protein [Alphaproteobacteria bacterium]
MIAGAGPAAATGAGDAARAAPARRILDFARLARDNGFRLGAEESLDALRVAHEVGVLEPRRLRAGLRSLFCACQSDWRRFDELFDAYWFGRRKEKLVERRKEPPSLRRLGAGRGPGEAQDGARESDAGAPGEGRAGGGASALEALGRRDFATVTEPAQLELLSDLIERLARRMRQRLTRRFRQRRRGRRVDLRRTIHRSLAYGGVPIDLARMERRRKPYRLVILLDVSGSMSLYSTFFLHFVRGVLGRFRAADAFAFHTRLVPIGEALKSREPETAAHQLALISGGWGGGTRIGECLASFNRHYAPRAVNSRSVVMIVSDGLDTGAPEVLARELAKIRGRAARLVWLNPLLGRPGYQPKAAGMAAALPHIDLFAPAHNLESLAALEPDLARL